MNGEAGRGSVYLETYLAPFAPWLNRADVTDILVNRPGEVWVERLGGQLERHDAPELSEQSLARLAQQIASASHQGLNREHPLLSATLPSGERVQICAPPATRAHLALAIRKHVVQDLTLEDYARAGALADVRQDAAEGAQAQDLALQQILADGNVAGFLREAVVRRKTILVSGGTSTGKTTMLNALLKEAPATERLVVIEDAPEVQLTHPNAVGLVAVRGDIGESRVTAEDLLQAALRLRPDRIILGELRGREAFAFLRAVNTGHPGSITTVHADSPAGAINQIALLVLQSGLNLRWEDIRAYVRGAVDIIVQLERRAGKRVASRIYFDPQRRRADALAGAAHD
jgi:type IV secretion system protein VirB11